MKKLLFSFFIIILNACADITPSDLIDSHNCAKNTSPNSSAAVLSVKKIIKEKKEPQEEEISPVAHELFRLTNTISVYKNCIQLEKNERKKKDCIEKLAEAEHARENYLSDPKAQRMAMVSELKQAAKLAKTPEARQDLLDRAEKISREAPHWHENQSAIYLVIAALSFIIGNNWHIR